MPEIIEDIEIFKDLIDRLYQKVTVAQEDCLTRNRTAGISEADRATFEEVDLVEIADELLSIQKTLHHRRFSFSYTRNWDYFKKARFLAFAGICQFVKDRYNGAFWDDYEREIGLGANHFVYDKIWAPAFELTGAELITSKGRNRREFVDSFVNETGIPRHLQESLITFFEFYWTYFRDQHFEQGEIENLIIGINKGEVSLSGYGPLSTQILKICRDIKEVSSSFARRLEKIVIVAEFIKNSNEIQREVHEANYELISDHTAIDPTTIFRNRRRLERFWGVLFKRVTPSQLNNLVIKSYPNIGIEKPDGSTIGSSGFKCDMYGLYKLGEMEVICVPDVSISLESICQLDYDRIYEVSAGLLAITEEEGVLLWEKKSKGKTEGAVGLECYLGGYFYGYVFFKSYEIELDVVRLKGSGSGSRDSIIPSAKKYFNPRLVARWNWRRKRFALYVRLGSVGVINRARSYEDCFIKSNGREKTLAVIQLDEHGSGKGKLKDFIVSNPFPREFSFFSEFKDEGGDHLGSLELGQAMLFTRRGGRQILPGVFGDSKTISTAGFVMFLSPDLNIDDLILENLNIERSDDERLGSYQVLNLSWVVTQRPCEVRIDEDSWMFETCVEFDFEFRRISWTRPESVRIPRFAATTFEDFELHISPSPTAAEERFLELSISDTDGPLFSLPIAKLAPQKISEEYSAIFGETLKRAIEPFTQAYSKPTQVVFSLISNSEVIVTQDFVFLPELEARFKDLKPGLSPSVELLLNSNNEWQSYPLGRTGSDTQLGEVELLVDSSSDSLSVSLEKYTACIIEAEFDLNFEVKVDLCAVEAYLWHTEELYYSNLHDVPLSDLSCWQLVVIDPLMESVLECPDELERLPIRTYDEQVCQRYRLVTSERMISDTAEINFSVGGYSFSFTVTNHPTVEDIFIRSNTRRSCVVGKHVVRGGTNYSVLYRIFDENNMIIGSSRPIACSLTSNEAEEFVIPISRKHRERIVDSNVFVKCVLSHKSGREEMIGEVIPVSTRDRLIDEDLGWATHLIIEREASVLNKIGGCESILKMIDESDLSSEAWLGLQKYAAGFLLRKRIRIITSSCENVLNNDFKVYV